MAAARVQFAGGNNGGVGGEYQIALTSGTTFGNLLVVAIGSFKGFDAIPLADIQDNLGNQYTAALDYMITQVDRISVFMLPNIPAGINNLIIRQSQPSAAVVLEYSGTASLVDVVGSAQTQTDTGGVTTWNTPGTRISSSSGVFLLAAVAQVSPSGFVGSGGFSLVQEQDLVPQSVSFGVLDQVNLAAGNYTPGGTVNASMQVDSCAIAFK